MHGYFTSLLNRLSPFHPLEARKLRQGPVDETAPGLSLPQPSSVDAETSDHHVQHL